jgi:hypothetical protein
MKREKPQGGWPIEEIAQVIGADPQKLRSYAIRMASCTAIKQGRFISTELGLEFLLEHASNVGVEPAVAFDRWYKQPSTKDVVQALQAAGLDKASFREAAVHLKDPSGISGTEGRTQGAEILAQTVIDLLSIVAAQQQQIIELSRKVEAATVTEVQSRIHDQASEHLHKVLVSSAKALKDLGNPVGSVTAGTVTHKGSITIRRSASSKDAASSKTTTENQIKTKVDVAAEMKGLAARLAAADLKVKIDTSQLDKRTEVLSRQNESQSMESFQGELEIQYQGISVTVGK